MRTRTKSLAPNRYKSCTKTYASRIIEVENATFTPLVFTTTGGMSQECQWYHSRLAELISSKKQEPGLRNNNRMDWNESVLRHSADCPSLFEGNKGTEKKNECSGE